MNKSLIQRKIGSIAPVHLIATAFIALATILGLSTVTLNPIAEIKIEPLEKVVEVGDIFEIQIVVEATQPVNVFSGVVTFNPEVLRIKSIDYNTSIADLWVDIPWYSNGDGTLTFGGGTTRAGGFTGKDHLIKVIFETLKEGDGIIKIKDSRILKHDGLGTDVELADAKEAIFTVTTAKSSEEGPYTGTEQATTYKVATELPTTDLNGDGQQNLADISIFMLKMASNNPQLDFNLDGKVDLKDLNILLSK